MIKKIIYLVVALLIFASSCDRDKTENVDKKEDVSDVKDVKDEKDEKDVSDVKDEVVCAPVHVPNSRLL